MKKILLFLVMTLSSLFSFWYQVDLPSPTSNIQSEWTILSSSSQKHSYFFNVFKVLTTYIWLFTWVVAFWVVLYAWFLLVSSHWTPEDLKKANKMLVWWLVWIFVSLLSYLLVKVLINLF